MVDNSRIRTLTTCPKSENNSVISSLVALHGRLPTKIVSDSSIAPAFSFNTGVDCENVRDDTTSRASGLGTATATRRVPASALMVRVAGADMRRTVRRLRRACVRRALANIFVVEERDSGNRKLSKLPVSASRANGIAINCLGTEQWKWTVHSQTTYVRDGRIKR